MAVLKNDDIVGHAPQHLSRIFYFFLSHDGTIDAEVFGPRNPVWKFLAATFSQENSSILSVPEI